MAPPRTYTRYLTVSKKRTADYSVGVIADSPLPALQEATQSGLELRYSPIMPAYIAPGARPPRIPKRLDSVGFLFAASPYNALGKLKRELSAEQAALVYFTEGLASLVVFNVPVDELRRLSETIKRCPTEHWPLTGGRSLQTSDVTTTYPRTEVAKMAAKLPSSPEVELAVYIEQIASSLSTLAHSYALYDPSEVKTLDILATFTQRLVNQYTLICQHAKGSNCSLLEQKKANSIVSALVEISAALSYAVTQGASGCTPILANKSPFPHHSLLGIGGSVRALTRYTRYLENAFTLRSAARVIGQQYSELQHAFPNSIPKYASGDEYRFVLSGTEKVEVFDTGGDFQQSDHVPLVTHFSLRHGFMESKFSVTAASESLTAEIMPQWTLMTLSHEIMHSRVRTIFQALFGSTWTGDSDRTIRVDDYIAFKNWHEGKSTSTVTRVAEGLRNAILSFCLAQERLANPVPKAQAGNPKLTIERLTEYYARHKQLAIEMAVHFHDYYFAYAYQQKIYMMSLWASWLKVAAPFHRTPEYLARSLATVAIGTGQDHSAAYEQATEVLSDSLDALEASGVTSPLFGELRRLCKCPNDSTYAAFKPLYYLADQFRLFFASAQIASRIDKTIVDPFAEGSTVAGEYAANIHVYGDGDSEPVSPIRYSLAALFRTLSGKTSIDDPQWLTAWNYMVISS